MDNERDRRSWPDEDRPTDEPADEAAGDAGSTEAPPPEPDWTASGDAPAPTPAAERPADEDAAAATPAEIESWPSQEPIAAEPAEGSAAADETRAWPTEPPTAGSAAPDGWPTSAPERSDEPVADSPSPETPDATEVAAAAAADSVPADRAPEEVEAYPATSTADAAPAAHAAAAAPAQAVPDSEGSTGESTQCPRCGTENRPGLSFCRNCGQRLVAAGVASTVERPGTPEGTQACPRCGTHNRAGVAFCQNCGANLRGTAEGYVPPAAPADERAPAAEPATHGAVLGPVVLLIGLAGLITAYLLPFLYGSDSLFDRAWGADGYGIAFWNGYPDVSASLADQAYFGLAGPVPILGLILLVLAVAGFMRATPGRLQSLGLGIALLWSVGLIVLFLVVEVLGSWDGDVVGLLRVLTPAGIIFFLSGLIVLIGTLTRFSRG